MQGCLYHAVSFYVLDAVTQAIYRECGGLIFPMCHACSESRKPSREHGPGKQQAQDSRKTKLETKAVIFSRRIFFNVWPPNASRHKLIASEL